MDKLDLSGLNLQVRKGLSGNYYITERKSMTQLEVVVLILSGAVVIRLLMELYQALTSLFMF